MILQTKDLTKKYSDFLALAAVSMNREPEDIYSLVGRNGKGKTSLLRCIRGLQKPSSGSFEIMGEKKALNQEGKKIGFMISSAFFPYQKARENLNYLAKLKSIGDSKEREKGLSYVELQNEIKMHKSFSLEMKQRLGIAGALLGSPRLVIVDEPINGFNPQGIKAIREPIKYIHKKKKTTFLISSHILAELDLLTCLSRRVAILAFYEFVVYLLTAVLLAVVAFERKVIGI